MVFKVCVAAHSPCSAAPLEQSAGRLERARLLGPGAARRGRSPRSALVFSGRLHQRQRARLFRGLDDGDRPDRRRTPSRWRTAARRSRSAFFAALDRPEIWLFWGPYGLWLFWKDPGARKLVIGSVRADPGALVPARVLGLGSLPARRQPRSASALQQPRVRRAARSARSSNDHAWPTVLLRIKVAAALAVVAAALAAVARAAERARDGGWRRNARAGAGRDRSPRACSALGWWVVIGDHDPGRLLGQQPLPGARRGADRDRRRRRLGLGRARARPRPSLAVIVGCPRRRRPGSWRSLASVACSRCLFAAASRTGSANSLIDMQRTHRALVYQAHLRGTDRRRSSRLGGSSKILACGSVMTEGFQVPMLAWNARRPHARRRSRRPCSRPDRPASAAQRRSSRRAPSATRTCCRSLSTWPTRHLPPRSRTTGPLGSSKTAG